MCFCLIYTHGSKYTTWKLHDRLSAMKFSIKKKIIKKRKNFLPASSKFQKFGLRNYSLFFFCLICVCMYFNLHDIFKGFTVKLGLNDQVFYWYIYIIFFRGRQFIWDHLRMEDVSCYWETLLKKYAKLLKFKPKRNKNYKQIN